jgi:ABC-type Fe3+-siderophore transport system permease subunit
MAMAVVALLTAGLVVLGVVSFVGLWRQEAARRRAGQAPGPGTAESEQGSG